MSTKIEIHDDDLREAWFPGEEPYTYPEGTYGTEEYTQAMSDLCQSPAFKQYQHDWQLAEEAVGEWRGAVWQACIAEAVKFPELFTACPGSAGYEANYYLCPNPISVLDPAQVPDEPDTRGMDDEQVGAAYEEYRKRLHYLYGPAADLIDSSGHLYLGDFTKPGVPFTVMGEYSDNEIGAVFGKNKDEDWVYVLFC